MGGVHHQASASPSSSFPPRPHLRISHQQELADRDSSLDLASPQEQPPQTSLTDSDGQSSVLWERLHEDTRELASFKRRQKAFAGIKGRRGGFLGVAECFKTEDFEQLQTHTPASWEPPSGWVLRGNDCSHAWCGFGRYDNRILTSHQSVTPRSTQLGFSNVTQCLSIYHSDTTDPFVNVIFVLGSKIRCCTLCSQWIQTQCRRNVPWLLCSKSTNLWNTWR